MRSPADQGLRLLWFNLSDLVFACAFFWLEILGLTATP
jgi:hypothetical protein